MNINRCHYHTEYHRGILDKFQRNTTYQKDKNRNVLELVTPAPGDVVLDIGCSSGGSSFLMSRCGARVLGIDFDSQAIDVARSFLKRHNNDYPKCTFQVATAEDVVRDLKPNKITMIDFVEHVTDEDLMAIIQSLVKENTDWRLHIYTPNRKHWIERFKKNNFIIRQDPTHIALRDMDQTITILEKSGLQVIYSHTRPSHLLGVGFVERYLKYLPLIGPIFQRRLCIIAAPKRNASLS